MNVRVGALLLVLLLQTAPASATHQAPETGVPHLPPVEEEPFVDSGIIPVDRTQEDVASSLNQTASLANGTLQQMPGQADEALTPVPLPGVLTVFADGFDGPGRGVFDPWTVHGSPAWVEQEGPHGVVYTNRDEQGTYPGSALSMLASPEIDLRTGLTDGQVEPVQENLPGSQNPLRLSSIYRRALQEGDLLANGGCYVGGISGSACTVPGAGVLALDADTDPRESSVILRLDRRYHLAQGRDGVQVLLFTHEPSMADVGACQFSADRQRRGAILESKSVPSTDEARDPDAVVDKGPAADDPSCTILQPLGRSNAPIGQRWGTPTKAFGGVPAYSGISDWATDSFDVTRWAERSVWLGFFFASETTPAGTFGSSLFVQPAEFFGFDVDNVRVTAPAHPHNLHVRAPREPSGVPAGREVPTVAEGSAVPVEFDVVNRGTSGLKVRMEAAVIDDAGAVKAMQTFDAVELEPGAYHRHTGLLATGGLPPGRYEVLVEAAQVTSDDVRSTDADPANDSAMLPFEVANVPVLAYGALERAQAHVARGQANSFTLTLHNHGNVPAVARLSAQLLNADPALALEDSIVLGAGFLDATPPQRTVTVPPFTSQDIRWDVAVQDAGQYRLFVRINDDAPLAPKDLLPTSLAPVALPWLDGVTLATPDVNDGGDLEEWPLATRRTVQFRDIYGNAGGLPGLPAMADCVCRNGELLLGSNATHLFVGASLPGISSWQDDAMRLYVDAGNGASPLHAFDIDDGQARFEVALPLTTLHNETGASLVPGDVVRLVVVLEESRHQGQDQMDNLLRYPPVAIADGEGLLPADGDAADEMDSWLTVRLARPPAADPGGTARLLSLGFGVERSPPPFLSLDIGSCTGLAGWWQTAIRTPELDLRVYDLGAREHEPGRQAVKWNCAPEGADGKSRLYEGSSPDSLCSGLPCPQTSQVHTRTSIRSENTLVSPAIEIGAVEDPYLVLRHQYSTETYIVDDYRHLGILGVNNPDYGAANLWTSGSLVPLLYLPNLATVHVQTLEDGAWSPPVLVRPEGGYDTEASTGITDPSRPPRLVEWNPATQASPTKNLQPFGWWWPTGLHPYYRPPGADLAEPTTFSGSPYVVDRLPLTGFGHGTNGDRLLDLSGKTARFLFTFGNAPWEPDGPLARDFGWRIEGLTIAEGRQFSRDLAATAVSVVAPLYDPMVLGLGPGAGVELNVTVENEGTSPIDSFTVCASAAPQGAVADACDFAAACAAGTHGQDAAASCPGVARRIVTTGLAPGEVRHVHLPVLVPAQEGARVALNARVVASLGDDFTANDLVLGRDRLDVRASPDLAVRVGTDKTVASPDETRAVFVQVENRGNVPLTDFSVTRAVVRQDGSAGGTTIMQDTWTVGGSDEAGVLGVGASRSLALMATDPPITLDDLRMAATGTTGRFTLFASAQIADDRNRSDNLDSIRLRSASILHAQDFEGGPAIVADGTPDVWFLDGGRLRAGNASTGEIPPGADATVELAALDLRSARDATLSMRHTFDLEAAPEAGFDAARVEISTDGGATWRPLRPEPQPLQGLPDGYSPQPLAGDSALAGGGQGGVAFTGSSVDLDGADLEGWIESQFDLGSDPELRRPFLVEDLRLSGFESRPLPQPIAAPGGSEFRHPTWSTGEGAQASYWWVQNLTYDAPRPRSGDTMWWSGSVGPVIDKGNGLTEQGRLENALELNFTSPAPPPGRGTELPMLLTWWEWKSGHADGGTGARYTVRLDGLEVRPETLATGAGGWTQVGVSVPPESGPHTLRLEYLSIASLIMREPARASNRGWAVDDVQFVSFDADPARGARLDPIPVGQPDDLEALADVAANGTTGAWRTAVESEKLQGPLAGGDAKVRWGHVFTRPGTFEWKDLNNSGIAGTITVEPHQARPAGHNGRTQEANIDYQGATSPSLVSGHNDIKIYAGDTVVWRLTGSQTAPWEFIINGTFTPADQPDDQRWQLTDHGIATPAGWHVESVDVPGQGATPSWRFADDSVQGYPSSAESRVVTPLVDLDTAGGDLRLRFDHRFGFESKMQCPPGTTASTPAEQQAAGCFRSAIDAGAVEYQVYDPATDSFGPWQDLRASQTPKPLRFDALQADCGQDHNHLMGDGGQTPPCASHRRRPDSLSDVSGNRDGFAQTGYNALLLRGQGFESVHDYAAVAGESSIRFPVGTGSEIAGRHPGFIQAAIDRGAHTTAAVQVHLMPWTPFNVSYVFSGSSVGPGGWQRESWDLSELAGKQVRFAFHATSNPGFEVAAGMPAMERRGWTVTNVRIEGEAFDGKDVLLRLRVATDSTTPAGSWRIDDVRVAGTGYQRNAAVIANGPMEVMADHGATASISGRLAALGEKPLSKLALGLVALRESDLSPYPADRLHLEIDTEMGSFVNQPGQHVTGAALLFELDKTLHVQARPSIPFRIDVDAPDGDEVVILRWLLLEKLGTAYVPAALDVPGNALAEWRVVTRQDEAFEFVPVADQARALRFEPASPTLGQPFALHTTVRNVGTTEPELTVAWRIEEVLHKGGPGQKRVGAESTRDLAAAAHAEALGVLARGEAAEVGHSATLQTPGLYRVSAVVLAGGREVARESVELLVGMGATYHATDFAAGVPTGWADDSPLPNGATGGGSPAALRFRQAGDRFLWGLTDAEFNGATYCSIGKCTFPTTVAQSSAANTDTQPPDPQPPVVYGLEGRALGPPIVLDRVPQGKAFVSITQSHNFEADDGARLEFLPLAAGSSLDPRRYSPAFQCAGGAPMTFFLAPDAASMHPGRARSADAQQWQGLPPTAMAPGRPGESAPARHNPLGSGLDFMPGVIGGEPVARHTIRYDLDQVAQSACRITQGAAAGGPQAEVRLVNYTLVPVLHVGTRPGMESQGAGNPSDVRGGAQGWSVHSLRVSSLAIEAGPDGAVFPVQAGAPKRFFIAVTNAGQAEDVVEVVLDPLASAPASWIVAPAPVAIAPGATVRVPVEVAVPFGDDVQAGAYTLPLRVRSTSDPGVSDLVDAALRVRKGSLPDLEPTLSTDEAGRPFTAGSVAPLHVTVFNNGDTASRPTSVAIERRAGDVYERLAMLPVGVLCRAGTPEPGCTGPTRQTATFEWTVPATPGTYEIRAVVDPLQSVAEESETNNIQTLQIVVTALSAVDVAVTKLQVDGAAGRATAEDGQLVGITAEATNLGTTAATDVRFRIRFGSSTIKDERIPVIEPGQTVSIHAPKLVSAGDFTVAASVLHSAVDGDLDNDEMRIPLHVKKRDLLMRVPAEDLRAAPGGGVSFGFNVTNRGTGVERVEVVLKDAPTDWSFEGNPSKLVVPPGGTIETSGRIAVPAQALASQVWVTVAAMAEGRTEPVATLRIPVNVTALHAAPTLTAADAAARPGNATIVVDVASRSNAAQAMRLRVDPEAWSVAPVPIMLPASGTRSADVPIRIPRDAAVGPHIVTVTAIDEAGREVAKATATVDVGPRAAAHAEWARVDSLDDSGFGSTTRSFELVVQNTGNVAIDLTVGLRDLASDLHALQDDLLFALEPGESRTVPLAVESGPAATGFFATAQGWMQAQGSVQQTRAFSLELASRTEQPDVRVQDVVFAPRALTAGRSIVATVEVRNVGNAPAPAGEIHMYAAGVLAQAAAVPALPAGGSTNITLPATISKTGSVDVVFLLDGESLDGELGDNGWSTSVEVPKASSMEQFKEASGLPATLLLAALVLASRRLRR